MLEYCWSLLECVGVLKCWCLGSLGDLGVLLEFLDPVGSLVSTLWVGWWVGCHTFSKFVHFERCSVVMMEC